jgi:hypothetical protein
MSNTRRTRRERSPATAPETTGSVVAISRAVRPLTTRVTIGYRRASRTVVSQSILVHMWISLWITSLGPPRPPRIATVAVGPQSTACGHPAGATRSPFAAPGRTQSVHAQNVRPHRRWHVPLTDCRWRRQPITGIAAAPGRRFGVRPPRPAPRGRSTGRDGRLGAASRTGDCRHVGRRDRGGQYAGVSAVALLQRGEVDHQRPVQVGQQRREGRLPATE